MDKIIIVNCVKCSAIIGKFKERKEFSIDVRCGHCGVDQTIICEIFHQIRIIEKLSTEHLVAREVKKVV